ncbi:MAG: biotin--[Clostridia bacterium]|nr:biotin--[acetyl-CoA-carboxylase] ligase [Clostridia bacterium]
MQNEKNTVSAEYIKNNLKTEYIGKDFYYFDEVSSTFDIAENIPIKSGTVIYAKKQTNGRGRLGRSWESEEGGIYFSIILVPDMSFEEIHIMTALCAVGIKRAVSSYLPCKIKWPNDIVSEDGKKICGILTKLRYDGNNKAVINVGIGINANTKSFDKELKYASSISLITGKDASEGDILCRVLEEIESCCNPKTISKIMDEYKKDCITLGKRVRVIYANDDKSIIGLCKDINRDGSLSVETDEGETLSVTSGEVSVRGIYGESYV